MMSKRLLAAGAAALAGAVAMPASAVYMFYQQADSSPPFAGGARVYASIRAVNSN
jgi:hypothetical protein